MTLLKLASPAQYTARISPVCLASSNEALPEGLKCVTTGWGRTSGVGKNLGENEGSLEEASWASLTTFLGPQAT